MGNRKGAEEFILKYIEKILPGENVNIYRNRFKEMSNKEFEQLMVDVRDGNMILPIIAPNGHGKRLSVDRNYKLAKELDVHFFQRLIIDAHDGVPKHMTKNKYLLLNLPIRRTAQLLTKGVATATDNGKRDLLTGAVTGDSKSTTLTYPEIQVLSGIGLEKSVKELMNVRGGDIGANRALEAMIERYGKVTFNSLAPYKTGVTGIKTLKSFFAAAHIKADI